MDLNKPIILNTKFRGSVLFLYQIFGFMVYNSYQSFTHVIPIIIAMGLLIISGFIANGVKFVVVKIHKKFYMKKILEPIRLLETENCCICLDDMEKNTIAYKLCCNHIFHGECIKIWYEHQQTCPLCRIDIIHGGPIELDVV